MLNFMVHSLWSGEFGRVGVGVLSFSEVVERGGGESGGVRTRAVSLGLFEGKGMYLPLLSPFLEGWTRNGILSPRVRETIENVFPGCVEKLDVVVLNIIRSRPVKRPTNK